MHHSQRRCTVLLWAGVLFFCLALASVALPGLGYARAAGKGGVTLEGSAKLLTLPAGQQYGIYVDDTDNGGYSEQCSITDADGHQVQQRDPWWTASSSDTETLDIVFNTGSGKLTIDCSISAERVTVRPVPNLKGLLIGIALAGAFGCAGVATLVVRTRLRSAHSLDEPTPAYGPHPLVLPPPAWYPDPRSPDRLRYWDGSTWTEHVHS
jgi:hypothetical protein